jgi:UDP-2,3-diacylglucosamine hydrolase
MIIEIEKGKKIYFVSDAHLGLPPAEESRMREKLLVRWLDEKRKDAAAFFLMGDIFDYWFEYKKVVPRGFVRLLGKLAELSDDGIPLYFFTGNHDVWVFNYLPEETGIKVFREPVNITINSKKFYLAHGDGLGPAEYSYKVLKKIFTSRILQWLYARIHPNSATGFAHRWSKKSRFSKGNYTSWLGEEKEHLVIHSKQVEAREHNDFYIYGHRHVPRETIIAKDSKVVYLGDWFVNFTYAEFDGKDVYLKEYRKEL